jgi:uncharacterized protein DUF6932
VLPPFIGSDPTGAGSPYWTTAEEIGQRFAHNSARKIVFHGFLKYRQALRGVGVYEAFQWVNGSFIEDVERMQNRSPRDVDVVTFGRVPIDPRDVTAKKQFALAHQDLFDPKVAQKQYLCDAYFVDLSLDARQLIERSKYWSDLFSHRRATYLWKGMVALPLNTDDVAAWTMVS